MKSMPCCLAALCLGLIFAGCSTPTGNIKIYDKNEYRGSPADFSLQTGGQVTSQIALNTAEYVFDGEFITSLTRPSDSYEVLTEYIKYDGAADFIEVLTGVVNGSIALVSGIISGHPLGITGTTASDYKYNFLELRALAVRQAFAYPFPFCNFPWEKSGMEREWKTKNIPKMAIKQNKIVRVSKRNETGRKKDIQLLLKSDGRTLGSGTCAQAQTVLLAPLAEAAINRGENTFAITASVGEGKDKISGKRDWVFTYNAADILSVAKRGYVIGRAYIELAGIENVYQDVVESTTVEIGRVKDGKLIQMTATTDSQGYFVLPDQPMDAVYYLCSIKGSAFSMPVPSPIPDPETSDGLVRLLYYMFGGQKDGTVPVIDIGENIIKVKAEGRVAFEQRRKDSIASIDGTRETPVDHLKQDVGYPALKYYSRSKDPKLRQVAVVALKEIKQLEEAESQKK